MTEVDESEWQQGTMRAQVQLIMRSVPDVAPYPNNWDRPGGGVEYFYRRGHVLVRDEDVQRVSEVLGGGEVLTRNPLRRDRNPDGTPPEPERDPQDWERDRDGTQVTDEESGARARTRRTLVPSGLSLFRIPSAPDRTTIESLELVDQQLGPGIVTPDHLLFVVGHASSCPAVEPDPEPSDADPIPRPVRGDAGNGVLVHILDSGLYPDAVAHSWLATGVTGDVENTYFPNGDAHAGEIMSYAGHGTFCAGTLRTAAPGAEVHVFATYSPSAAGAEYESNIAAQVQYGLSSGADIISLSAGCYTRDDIPSLGFDVILELIAKYKGVVLVAAAGNDATRQPFWPAASPGVVAVGALDADLQHRAKYSNYGGWVDVYAPGTDLVNAFVDGKFTYIEPPKDTNPGSAEFKGMAKWSGTSFATPYVAGLIAAEMSRTGQNGQDAAKAVLARAHLTLIDGGAALLP